MEMVSLETVVVVGLMFLIAAAIMLTALRVTRHHITDQPVRCSLQAKPMISIHLPISSEPPGVVAKTLQALSHLDYPAFEVIVFDNNTKDPGLWQPVERLCRRMGERFRFYHVEKIEGHKAGALNRCLALTDPSAKFILTLDADYEIEPRFLSRAVRAIASPDVSHIQFPQAYRGVEPTSAPLSRMFDRYFRHFAADASISGSMLLTGTLSLIRIDALRKVGGWPTDSLTEDAALGVRFWQAGYHGWYRPEVGGRGLLPFSLSGLRQQRRRWAAGNAQVLRTLLYDEGRRRLLTPSGLSVLAQLGAWLDLRLLPGMIVLLGGVLYLFQDMTGGTTSVIEMASVVLLAMTGLQIAEWLLISHRLGQSLRESLSAWRMQESLSFASMRGSLDLVVRSRLGFRRTPKMPAVSAMMLPDAADIWHAAALLAMTSFLIAEAWLPALASLFLLLPALFGLEASRRLEAYGRRAAPSAATAEGVSIKPRILETPS